MNRAVVDRIADAVLYEGYILYPYRRCVKNRHRWTFGGLLPEAYCLEHPGTGTCSNQTECLVQGSPETQIEVTVRFLHPTDRIVGQLVPPLARWPGDSRPAFHPVEALEIGKERFYPWQEAEARHAALAGVALADLLAGPRQSVFAWPAKRWLEPLHGPSGEIAGEIDGEIVGVLVRAQQALEAIVELGAVRVAPELFRVTLRVRNATLLEHAEKTRDEAAMRSLVSTHAILAVRGGEFVSLFDPPDPWQEHAAACRNAGVWPVLVGEPGRKDTMLSAPIILYDYPQVAPESPGNFFDGTEIDEILSLRILTMTDEEKRQMAGVDELAAALLARTEALAREQLLGLHGTLRGSAPPSAGARHG